MTVQEPIPAVLANERLDRVVALLADLPRSASAGLIERGGVTVDGAVVVHGKRRVREGQVVAVDVAFLPVPSRPSGDPAVPVDVVWQDDDVVVVDKQAGTVVHPGAGNPDGTLVNGLLARYPDIADVGDPMRPGIVHRLDAGTTGLMVVARTQAAYDSLVAALSRREVERRYWALVWGVPSVAQGVIDAPIGRDQREPTRMAVVAGGREARTRYEVVRRFSVPRPSAQLECRLETGRTHQIRVHLSSIGHPVVGDAVYGGSRGGISAARPMLHAHLLAFVHPVTGGAMRFESPVPADMAAVLEGCGE
ncbi:MAG: RluA family pseudouridine synthase [Actinobacteria bacterium]|nr:RluA family pseudouridine synthase [Actinomycetota bacterium]